jgi:hypothetical protein
MIYNMTTFQSEYETTTQSINNIVQSSVSSVMDWVNIPGTLVKASSSAAGYVWGYNAGNSVYICQLPCTGNWKPVDLSNNSVSNILDMTTDDTNVYILFSSGAGNPNMLISDATGQGVPTVIPLQFQAKNIFSTHTYIWAQDAGNTKQRCPKPCTMPNWQTFGDTVVVITSSTDTALYGKDPTGVAMQSDETLQTNWKPIPGLSKTKINSIIGAGDDSILYGLDQVNNLFEYDGSVKRLTTDGYAPMNMSVDPTNRQLWMTSQTPGDTGNVFYKLQKSDYTSVSDNIAPLDRKRDDTVKDISSEYSQQTNIMAVNKIIDDVVSKFKGMFNLDRNTHKKAKAQAGHIVEDIRETQIQIDQIKTVEPYLLESIILLALLCLLYIFGSGLLGTYIHIVALALLGGGIAFIANFSVSNK